MGCCPSIEQSGRGAEPIPQQVLETSLAHTVQQTMQIQVPVGAQPGQQMQVNANGSIVAVVIPEGAAPGEGLQKQNDRFENLNRCPL
jgi:hypothetical protein